MANRRTKATEKLQLALVDALALFDRVATCKGNWTIADIKRIAELRQLAAGKGIDVTKSNRKRPSKTA